VLPPGALKIRASAAPEELRLRAGPRKKWIDLEKGDLEILRKVEVPHMWRGRAVGPVISGATPVVSAATNYNRMKAIICRMFAAPPPPQRGIWNWAAQFKREIWPEYDFPPSPMTDQEWLDSVPAARKRPLTEAMALWRLSGWSRKYETFHSFIKEEWLPGFRKEGNDLLPLREMVDRLINAPHDVTHCIAGPKIKPYMAWLKMQWSLDTHLFYGGTTPEKTQQWLHRATGDGPKLVFWSDYTMYDSSFNSDVWEFIEDFYSQHKDDAEFARVLECWRAPKGKLGDLKYQGRVMNASGRDDTALANALLNGIAMLLSVTAAWYQKPLLEVAVEDIHRISTILLLSVCGDDALGFLPTCTHEKALDFIDRARSNLALMGFKAKMFCSFRFEDAVYLGHRPLPIGGRYYWSRTVGRALYKLGWQVRIRGDPSAHFMGIAKMHVECSGHVPILGDLCKAWVSARPHAKVNAWRPDDNKPWQQMGKLAPPAYDDSTIAAFASAYTVAKSDLRGDLDLQDVCVTPAAVRECIAYVVAEVEKCRGRPCVLDHWLLRHMVLVDEQ
jgi:hypothetical protein